MSRAARRIVMGMRMLIIFLLNVFWQNLVLNFELAWSLYSSQWQGVRSYIYMFGSLGGFRIKSNTPLVLCGSSGKIVTNIYFRERKKICWLFVKG